MQYWTKPDILWSGSLEVPWHEHRSHQTKFEGSTILRPDTLYVDVLMISLKSVPDYVIALFLLSIVHAFKTFYHFLSFTLFRSNYYGIDPLYLYRPFCPSALWHCRLGYVACKKFVPEMTFCVSGGTLNPTHSLGICSFQVAGTFRWLCLRKGKAAYYKQ